MFVLTLTDDKLLKFVLILGEEERKVVLCLFGEKSWAGLEPLLAYYLFPSRVVPRAIRENVNNVVDWAGWLESVKDAEIRKRLTPEVEKLKKQIAELWGEKLTVEKGKSAFGKFAKQFIIRGDDSAVPQEFFRRARGEIVLLLRQNRRRKFNAF